MKNVNVSTARSAEGLIFALACAAMIVASAGGHWDGYIHAKQGHTLLAIPHLIILGGLALFGVTGALALFVLARSPSPLGPAQRRSMWLVAVGGLGVPAAALFDQAWHVIIGEDKTVWSVPHLLLLFFAGVVFLGCTLAAASRRSRVGLAWVTFSDWLVVLLAGVMFLPLFVAFAEYDQPILGWLADVRPGYAYPLAVSVAATFLLVVAASIMRKAGSITVSALGAYALYAGAGYVVSMSLDYYTIFPPFPLVVPALALDVWLYISRNTQNSYAFPLWAYLVSSALTATICYWTVVAWAVLYTHDKLPQQLSGSGEDWARWYGFALMMSVCVAVLARAVVLSLRSNET